MRVESAHTLWLTRSSTQTMVHMIVEIILRTQGEATSLSLSVPAVCFSPHLVSYVYILDCMLSNDIHPLPILKTEQMDTALTLEVSNTHRVDSISIFNIKWLFKVHITKVNILDFRRSDPMNL